MKSSLTVLVLGDDEVGKSTLISSLISKQYRHESKLAQILDDSNIPSDCRSSGVSLTLLDSHGMTGIVDKMKAADCILAVYDVTRPDTLENLRTVWLPTIRLLEDKPVVVVGTKIDLSHEHFAIFEEQILREFPFVVRCCRCTATQFSSIENVFEVAETSVNYPVAPFYDIPNHRFTTRCIQAFKRIFRIIDHDHDGYLSDHELNDFQHYCFGITLKKDEIQDMKKLIRRVDDDAKNNITAIGSNNMITYLGFERLMQLLIERELFKSLWTVLRRFDYDDSLSLEIPEYVTDKGINGNGHGNNGQGTEGGKGEQPTGSPSSSSSSPPMIPILSSSAIKFLKALPFVASLGTRHPSSLPHSSTTPPPQKQGAEQIVTQHMLKQVFSVLSEGEEGLDHPWKPYLSSSTSTSYAQGPIMFPVDGKELLQPIDNSSAGSAAPFMVVTQDVTLTTWLTQWYMLTAVAPLTVQKLLYLLGYVCDDEEHAGVVYRPILPDLPQQWHTDTTLIHVHSNHIQDDIVQRLFLRLSGSPDIDTDANNSDDKSSTATSLPSRILHKDSLVTVSSLTQGGWWSSLERVMIWRADADSLSLASSLSSGDSDGGGGGGGEKPRVKCDIVVILVDRNDPTSVQKARNLEELLPFYVPRLFAVLVSSEGTSPPTSSLSIVSAIPAKSDTPEDISLLIKYIQESNLPRLVWVNVHNGEGLMELKTLINHIAQAPEYGISKQHRRNLFRSYLVLGSGIALGIALGLLVVTSRQRSGGSSKSQLK